MDEELLEYYNRELSYLRKMGAEFAEKHPKIAGRLSLSEDIIEDPHVSRLVEGFAFLSARIRHKLEDTYPELTDALMGSLYPDYLASVPSTSVLTAQSFPNITTKAQVPSGSIVAAQDIQQADCWYRTCGDLDLWPVALADAQFLGRPYQLPQTTKSEQAQSALLLKMETLNETSGFDEIRPDRLRFFVKGQPDIRYNLLELVHNHGVDLVITDNLERVTGVTLDPESIQMVGFDDHERVLPYDNSGFSGFALLAEYFACPDKFCFFDVQLPSDAFEGFGNVAYVVIQFSRTVASLEKSFGLENLVFQAVPVVNQWQEKANPVYIDEPLEEFRVVPERNSSRAGEVQRVEHVRLFSGDRDISVKPFYDLNAYDKETLYWVSRRVPSGFSGSVDDRMETYVGLVDRQGKCQLDFEDYTMEFTVTLNSGDKPSRIPFGGDQPSVHPMTSADSVKHYRFVVPPTNTIRPKLRGESRWKLIKHLSLNCFTGAQATDNLKAMLSLYDFVQSRESKALIDGVVELKCTPITRRMRQYGHLALVQGTLIELELDESRFSGSGVFLFSAVMDRFFAQFCAMNSFTQLHCKTKDRTINQWKPRSGQQVLV